MRIWPSGTYTCTSFCVKSDMQCFHLNLNKQTKKANKKYLISVQEIKMDTCSLLSLLLWLLIILLMT